MQQNGSLTPSIAATSVGENIVSSQGSIKKVSSPLPTTTPAAIVNITPGASQDNNTITLGGSQDDNMKVESMIEDSICKFKKGGECIKHGIKGTRILTIKKVWEAKKNGLWGYRVRKQTSWQCTTGVSERPESDSCQNPSAQNFIAKGNKGVAFKKVLEHSFKKVKMKRGPAEDYKLDQVTAKRPRISCHI